MGKWPVRLVMLRDRRPSLVKCLPVTRAAQTLVEAGTRPAARTHAFVVELPVGWFSSVPRPIFISTCFHLIGLSHRSSSQYCTWLAHSGLTHTTPSPPV